jgi:hypothetical protein
MIYPFIFGKLIHIPGGWLLNILRFRIKTIAQLERNNRMIPLPKSRDKQISQSKLKIYKDDAKNIPLVVISST